MFGGTVGIIIQLIAGAVGGNIVGGLAKQLDLGVLWNSVAGIVGGGIGGQILGAVLGGGAVASSGLDIGSIIEQVAAGGVGGGVLMAIIGAIKQAMGGSAAAR
jgi:uncharacterized membrane protein YeaQ/YmgE (transglycosylase-associated protein family)